MGYLFSRKLRISANSDFKATFKQSRRWKSHNLTLFTRITERGNARLGISISKRQVKFAVDRNRIKRLIRESFRLHQSQLNSLDVVAVAYHGAQNMSNEQLITQLNQLWGKLIACYVQPLSS